MHWLLRQSNVHARFKEKSNIVTDIKIQRNIYTSDSQMYVFQLYWTTIKRIPIQYSQKSCWVEILQAGLPVCGGNQMEASLRSFYWMYIMDT